MKLRTVLAALAILTLTAGAAYAAAKFAVTANEFDPARTFLVQAQWLDGNRLSDECRRSADGSTITSHFTDAACATGDSSDSHNQGLPTRENRPHSKLRRGPGRRQRCQGITLTELATDIRSPVQTQGPGRGARTAVPARPASMSRPRTA